MRRILSKVIHCDDNLGDISTMADEAVLKELFATRQLAKRQYTWLRSLQEIHDFKTYLTIKQAKEDLRNSYG